ncbi:hypothetical protein BU26DRAFT_68913 [Trematosphaeria pertusa]|uniref:Uncharacterized protein n=1 Tax=Trematosphaeria pertusa TaxID=390896 RepID=A0A6A6I7E5_9PLEO|nr:uncharacterized protein BU26DRAFT_68913 [Trematosphaeria pertusa]KAF2245463.1 hypothetical protein BU26DRAFT_68913 [Trematosphaeria pertusa]
MSQCLFPTSATPALDFHHQPRYRHAKPCNVFSEGMKKTRVGMTCNVIRSKRSSCDTRKRSGLTSPNTHARLGTEEETFLTISLVSPYCLGLAIYNHSICFTRGLCLTAMSNKLDCSPNTHARLGTEEATFLTISLVSPYCLGLAIYNHSVCFTRGLCLTAMSNKLDC